MSLISRLQLAAAVICSKDDARGAITHLRVKSTLVEATDGKMLVRVTRTNGMKEDDFPSILPTGSKQPSDSVLIHRDTADKIAKALPKRARLPILQHAQVRLGSKEDILIGTTDLYTPQILTLQPFEGSAFPNTDQFIQQKESGKLTIGLSATLLGALCKYAAQFDNRDQMLEFTFYDDEKPVRVDWHDGDHTAIAVVMPMRLDKPKKEPVK